MALYQGAPCWCSQHSNEMRAIRELVTGISNGIHCILQKIHMDQIQNANMMARIMNTVEMVADTVTNLPIAQFQGFIFSVKLLLFRSNSFGKKRNEKIK